MTSNATKQNLINKQVIFMNDLTLQVVLGTTEWERQVARTVSINIAITTIFSNEVFMGDINQEYLYDFNYKNLVNLITDFSINHNFYTLQEMTMELEKLIINHYKLNNMVNLKIEIKVPFISKNLKEIGASIERTYANS